MGFRSFISFFAFGIGFLHYYMEGLGLGWDWEIWEAGLGVGKNNGVFVIFLARRLCFYYRLYRVLHQTKRLLQD